MLIAFSAGMDTRTKLGFFVALTAMLLSGGAMAIDLSEEKSLDQLLKGQPKWIEYGVNRCREEFRGCRGSDPELCVKQLDACLGNVVAAIDTKAPTTPRAGASEVALKEKSKPASKR